MRAPNFNQMFRPVGYTPPVDSPSKTTWDLPPGITNSRPIATSRGSNLFVLQSRTDKQNIIDQDHTIIETKLIPRDGYHADLLCYIPGQRLPLRVGLKFDAPNARPPTGNAGSWIFATPDGLVFGEETPGFGFSPSHTVVKNGCHGGIWLLPYAGLQTAIASAKKSQPQASQANSSGL
jgi:hypothetical protein